MFRIILSVCLLFPVALAHVAKAETAISESRVPQSALYVGLGAGFNTTHFGTQDIFAVGTSSIFNGGALIATGTAAGPGTTDTGTTFSVAPSVQVGYFRRLPNSDWLWGVNLQYQYIGASADTSRVTLPQAGTFSEVATGQVVPFVGTAVAQSYRTYVDHQFALLPYVGHVFGNGIIYGGAGPTLSRTRTKITGLVGFANIFGVPTDISGAPQNFSGANWGLGGMAAVGISYFITPSWFLDVRYAVSVSAHQTSNYNSTFTSPNPDAFGNTHSGTLVGNSSGGLIVHGLTFSINFVL